MELKFVITQESKNGTVSFRAAKVVNIGNAEVSSVSKEVSVFCKAVIELVEKNKTVGFNSFVGIKKSLPLSISIQSVDFDDEVNLRLDYKNFGRFIHTATRENLEQFLVQNIEFAELHGQNTEF